MPLEFVTLPCLSDNYAYLLHDAASGSTAVVDVPDADAVQDALRQRGWRLSHILLTHHHNDHIGGVDALRGATGAQVWGASADAARLPALDRAVAGGDILTFEGEGIQVLDVPGHTIGHIAYYFSGSGYLFSGDSLMAMGCGRLFEGTPEQMWDSLQKLSGYPDSTQLCSGHEYTQANTRFALTIDPENVDLKERSGQIDALRAAGKPTLPAPLGLEKATNPFLRAHLPAIKAALGLPDASDVESFAEIRRRKDAF